MAMIGLPLHNDNDSPNNSVILVMKGVELLTWWLTVQACKREPLVMISIFYSMDLALFLQCVLSYRDM